MAHMVKMSRVFSFVVGLALVLGAVYAVFYVEWTPEMEEEPSPVRPLKTLVVGDTFAREGRKYPGRVKAFREVDLSFEVPGRLAHFPVKDGQRVDEGEELARLDPRDYASAVAAAKAHYVQTETNLGRIAEAEESGAISGRELTNAEARFENAKAQLEIAEKGLADTHLTAPFKGIVANTFVENYEFVAASRPILSLQDVEEQIQIESSVPENRIVHARGKEGMIQTFATFEYLPGERFLVELEEVSTEADPLTQTYLLTFVMPAPKDYLILPGMTATLQAVWEEPTTDAEGRFAIPIDAVVIDELGVYYVWVVDEAGATMTVHRRDIEVELLTDDSLIASAGIEAGDRIAAAGVHFLVEGQQVTQFVPKAEGGGM